MSALYKEYLLPDKWLGIMRKFTNWLLQAVVVRKLNKPNRFKGR